jgi:hypothetical protein
MMKRGVQRVIFYSMMKVRKKKKETMFKKERKKCVGKQGCFRLLHFGVHFDIKENQRGVIK